MVVGREVPESGDDLEVVVDGVAAAAALPQYFPVFQSGDDGFDAGSDLPMQSVVVVADGPATMIEVMPRCAPSPRISWPVSRCVTVWQVTVASFRLPGQHWPATITWRRAHMMTWVLTLRRSSC